MSTDRDLFPIWWFFAVFILFSGFIVALIMQRVHRCNRRIRDLADQIEGQSKELSALNAIAAVVSNELGLPETLDIALQKTVEIMNVSAGVIFLLEEERDTAFIATVQGLDQGCIETLNHFPVAGNFLNSVIEQGESKVISNLTLDRSFEILNRVGYQRLALSPLIARGIVLGALFVLTREQRHFSNQDLNILSSIGAQIGVAVENSRLFEAEQHRAEQFRLIAAVGRRFSSLLDIDQVLTQVVHLIQQTFGYYHVAIGLIEGQEVVYRVGAGQLWDDPNFQFRPARLRVGQEGVSGWVAGTGQPLYIPDVSREPRYIWMQDSLCRSELVVPVIAKGLVIGVLDVQSDTFNDFDETDLAVIQALGNQAAIAIENARLYQQAQQFAVMEERARLARDLHDAVTQSIYSLTLLAEAGLRMIAQGDLDQIRDNQVRIDDIAQQALQEMRLLVYELRPVELRELGLAGAIEHRLEIVEQRAGIEARLISTATHPLPPELEEALYRIVQEALNNALKHARADAIVVEIDANDAEVLVNIRDNGRGFEPLAIGEHSGLGIDNMRERAAKINADLTISSGPGKGTVVSVKAPVGAGSDEKAEFIRQRSATRG